MRYYRLLEVVEGDLLDRWVGILTTTTVDPRIYIVDGFFLLLFDMGFKSCYLIFGF